MTEGLPKILDVLRRLNIKGTFFFTAEMLEKYPEAVEAVLHEGHELGMHGYRHERLDRLTKNEAKEVLRKMADAFSPYDASSFRAPNLQLPQYLFETLEEIGVQYDSSKAIYKGWRGGVKRVGGVVEIPVSVTSFVIRWPKTLREIHIKITPRPRVLFVHPWEFVDMRGTGVRWDCWKWTGDVALKRLEETLRWMLEREGPAKTIRGLGRQVENSTSTPK